MSKKSSSSMSSTHVVIVGSIFVGLIMILSSKGIDANPLKGSDVKTCSRTTPCGWLVYQPYVRKPDYYIHSPCSCAPDMKCVKVSDDISISAYVYRCRSESESQGLDLLPKQSSSSSKSNESDPNETDVRESSR